MSKEKKLVKNMIIYTIGNLGSKLISFFLLPFYTYYLTTKDYGTYDFITTIIALLVPIISLQLSDGVYRYILDSKSEKEKTYTISSTFAILICMIFISTIIYVVTRLFVDIEYGDLVFVAIIVTLISGILSQITRALKHNLDYAIGGLINTLFMILSNIYLVAYLGFKVEGLVISTIVSNAIVLVFYLLRVKIYKYIRFSAVKKQIVNKLCRFSIPLIPNTLNWWVMKLSDRVILKMIMGIDATGIYAIANKFPSFISVLNSIFYLAWQESAIEEYDSRERDKYYTKIFDQLSVFVLSGVILLLPITKIMMKFMVADSFKSAVLYIPFLYIGTAFSLFSSFYGTGYLSAKKTGGAFTTSIAGGIINIIINFLLIPKWGIQAASFSTMISFLFMWISRIYQTKEFFNIKLNIRKLVTILSCVVIFTMAYYINNVVVESIMVLLAIILFILFNLSFIKSKIKMIKR